LLEQRVVGVYGEQGPGEAGGGWEVTTTTRWSLNGFASSDATWNLERSILI
jgi:hypothetical protein